MPKRAALRTRIERLERRKTRRPFPRLILAIYGQPPESVIGYRNRGVVAMRTPGEPLDALEARAWELGSAFILEALYRPENRPSAAVTAMASDPLMPAERGDPFALAGIGREATAEELLAMGAVRLPPERLI